jgi:hypothetical protein
MRPVRKIENPAFVDTEPAQIRPEAFGRDGDGRRAPCSPTFEQRGDAGDTRAAPDAALPRRGSHEILEDEPVWRARACREEAGQQPSAQARHHAEYDVRPHRPRKSPVDQERRLIRCTAKRGLYSGNVVSTAEHPNSTV